MGLGGGNAFSIAASLMCMIYALGDVSGANFNPAVSLALIINGALDVATAGAYMGVQVLVGLLLLSPTVVSTVVNHSHLAQVVDTQQHRPCVQKWSIPSSSFSWCSALLSVRRPTRPSSLGSPSVLVSQWVVMLSELSLAVP